MSGCFLCLLGLLQQLQGGLGGSLLGILFAAALAGADGNIVEPDLHLEGLGMVRAGLAEKVIGQRLAALALDELLQGGLKVPAGVAHFGHIVQNEFLNDPSGLGNASVQIDGSQYGLNGVRPDGGPLSAAAGLFALAQLEVGAQVPLPGHDDQIVLTDETGPDAGEIALRKGGEVAVKVVRHHHAQD